MECLFLCTLHSFLPKMASTPLVHAGTMFAFRQRDMGLDCVAQKHSWNELALSFTVFHPSLMVSSAASARNAVHRAAMECLFPCTLHPFVPEMASTPSVHAGTMFAFRQWDMGLGIVAQKHSWIERALSFTVFHPSLMVPSAASARNAVHRATMGCLFLCTLHLFVTEMASTPLVHAGTMFAFQQWDVGLGFVVQKHSWNELALSFTVFHPS